MKRWYYPLSVAAVLLGMTSEGRAEVQISVGDLLLQPGQTGFVDVMIRSDTGTDLLDMFGLEFRITTAGTTRLEFVAPPSDPQLTDPGYLFFGDSLFALAPPAGNISTVSQLNDTYIGGDGTSSTLGVLVPTTDTLLASLEVTTATSNPPQLGDTFMISLDPGFSTFFYDPVFTPIGFSSTSGTVTIIPEPGGTVLFFFLLITLGTVGRSAWLSRKRAESQTPC